ncbi:hypothetical protein D3C77_590800 [compost metagenome]
MTEVAGEDVEQRAALQVAGTAQLAQVPVTPTLVLQHLGREHRGLLGEMPAEDHREGPQVAQQVGHEIAGQHRQGVGADQQGQQREEQVVLGPLADDLAVHLAQQRAHFILADAALEVLVQLHVLHRHGVLEQQRLQGGP